MKTNIQKRLSFFRFAMSLAIALSVWSVFFTITDTNAMSISYKEKLCERNFIWANYKPHLKKTCGLLWQKWTFDILNTHE